MSTKVEDAIRRREQAKIRPAPPRPKKATKKAPVAVETVDEPIEVPEPSEEPVE